MLHVVNGDSAARNLKLARVPGKVLPWRDVPTQRRDRPRRPSGILAGRERLNGKSRDYFFSYGDHPELTEAFKLEEQAKRHLYRDLYLLGRRLAEQ